MTKISSTRLLIFLRQESFRDLPVQTTTAIYLIEIEAGFWRDLYSYSTPRLLAGSPVARRVRVDDGSM